jgi:predicted GNAT family N-acyltransferase
MSIIYSTFHPKDATLYFDSYCSTIESLVTAWEQSPEVLKTSLEKVIQQWSIVHIAIDEATNEIVWTATTLIEQKLHRGGTKAWHIEDVATRAWRWWNGIGSQLIKNSIESAKNAWCYKIILDCTQEMSGYYEKFGFEVKGVEMKKYI